MNNNILRIELEKPINSLNLEKIELQKIMNVLQTKATEAKVLESTFIETLDDLKNIDAAKEELSKCSLLKLTIKGTKGEDLFGSIDEVFNADIFPEKIKSVYVNSEVPYVSQFNYHPRNFFQLFIDFSKPKVFDFSIQLNDKTPNNSYFKVEGYDSTWVNGVYSELDRFFLNKKLKFVHKVSTYDIVVWLLGMPFSFWVCFRFSNFINNTFINNSFLINAVFIYLFLFSLLSIRILFHYFRWVYPMIEFKNKNDKSITHKTVLYSVTVGMFGRFLWDVGKWLFHIS